MNIKTKIAIIYLAVAVIVSGLAFSIYTYNNYSNGYNITEKCYSNNLSKKECSEMILQSTSNISKYITTDSFLEAKKHKDTTKLYKKIVNKMIDITFDERVMKSSLVYIMLAAELDKTYTRVLSKKVKNEYLTNKEQEISETVEFKELYNAFMDFAKIGLPVYNQRVENEVNPMLIKLDKLLQQHNEE